MLVIYMIGVIGKIEVIVQKENDEKQSFSFVNVYIASLTEAIKFHKSKCQHNRTYGLYESHKFFKS
jgi:hypothetical protein